MLGGLGLGVGLIIAGLVFVIVVWLFLRLLTNGRPQQQPQFSHNNSPEYSRSKNAILVVQAGGRVEFLNEPARNLFGLQENQFVDLERLSRIARPSDDFMEICASEGQKQITIGGQLTEVASYRIPGPLSALMVTFRNLNLSTAFSQSDGDVSSSILRIITDFGQALASSRKLDATLRAIYDHVNRLVSSDVMEVKIWDADSRSMTPYRREDRSGRTGRLLRADQSLFGDYASSLISEKKVVSIPDTFSLNGDDADEVSDAATIRSFLGVPLLVDGKLVGTLEIGQMTSNAFGSHDVELLQLIAGQASAAIQNSLLYEAEQHRLSELKGLTNLAQAVSLGQDMKDLFDRLVKSLSPLFDVEIIGFLLYDEEKRTLEGQVPFQGLPPHIVEMYRASVSLQNVSAIIEGQKPLLTFNAAEDEHWEALGIHKLAQAASLRDSALVPLLSGRRMIGFLQLSNHRQGVIAFSDEELRLMKVFADQASAIIENAVLVQQSRQRAYRSDALRRIASLSVSSASVDEILEISVRELVHLFQADSAVIFLLDEQKSELRLHSGSVFGVHKDAVEDLSRLFVSGGQYRYTVSGSQKPFLSGRLSSDRRILSLYRPIVTLLRIESALAVPLVVRDRSMGELIIGSRKSEFFNAYDQQVASTVASQLAAMIESVNLANQTDVSLRQRVDQLTAITRISRELSASLDFSRLLEIIHEESIKASQADCCTILLLEKETENNYTHTHYIGCAPDDHLNALLPRLAAAGEPLVMDDFDSEPETPHEGVRSAALVPIWLQNELAGVIHLHASQPGHFSKATIEMMETMSVQASIAINTASQYQAERQRAEFLRRRAETLSKLTEINYALRVDQTLEMQLRTIATGITEATPFQVALFSVYEPETGLLRRVAGVGLPQETLAELLSRKQPLESVRQLLKAEFQISHSYFIPANQTPIIPADVHMVTLDLVGDKSTANAWDPDDFLLVLLEDAQGQPTGLLSVDAPSDGLRPDKATIEAIEIFAAQASLAIHNTMRIGELRTRVESLASGLERQERMLSVSKNDLPLLLNKDLEQTIAIHNLDRRAQRLRAGLAITESVSRQLDANSALLALGREVLTQLGMSVALVAEDAPDGTRLLHMLGSIPRATNPETLFGQRNPLRVCLQTGETILSANVDESEEWRDTPLLSGLRAKSFICLPITLEGIVVAAILAASPEPMPAFTDEDRQVYFQIARQTSVILQNISLLNETRRRLQEVNLLLDFSRQISGLDSSRIVEALLDNVRRVIQVAHAGIVFLWDGSSSRLIPIVCLGYADNESMMKITYKAGESLPGLIFAQKQSRRVDELNFAREYTLPAEDLSLYRQATGGRLPVSNVVIPIRTADHNLGVLLLDNFNMQSAFTMEDEMLLRSLTQQVALSLENVRLVYAAQERAGQLQALNEVATSMTSSLLTDELVASLLDQLNPVLPFDTATLLLRETDHLKVVAAEGFTDSERRLGLTVAVADSALFQEMIQSGQPLVVGDVRKDKRFPVVEAPHLSWLGIPLISKSEVIGAITLEKWQANFYTLDHLQVAMTFSGQAAVALENARLYEESLSRAAELDQRTQRLALLNRFSSQMSGLLVADEILQVTVKELYDSFNAKRAFAIGTDGDAQVLKAIAPKNKTKIPQPCPDSPLFARLQDSQGVYTSENFLSEKELEPLREFLGDEPASLLVAPVLSGPNLHGFLFILMDREDRFSSAEIELVVTIANQTAIASESARLFAVTQRFAEELEQRVIERTAELELEKGNTETLLRILSEVSASLDLDRALSRTLALLNEAVGAEQGTIMLLNVDDNLLHYRAGYGYLTGKTSSGGSSFTLKVGEGLAGWVVESRESALVHDLSEDERWVKSGTASSEHRSAIVTPLLVGEDVIGVLMVFHRKVGFFGAERLGLVKAIAGQVAIAINNANLYELIRDQAERLGGLLRKEQEEASRSQAILEAVADGVVVTGADNNITFLNSSAQRILGLEAQKVIGQPLDAFGGMFGQAATTWMQTINNWSDDPVSSQVGESYAEQLELEDGRIALVHLAPVILQDDFLGTVSIFRDITHEVEVDRLKSEFVATVSHELRTPMTSIRGYVDILLMGAAGALNENQTHFLQIVKNNTERLNILVNDLLDVSRIEAGRVTLTPQPLDLRDVAEDVLADILRRSQEENKPMAFSLDAPGKLPRVYGDSERVRQILSNLLDNAYHYTPENGQIIVHLSTSNGAEIQVDIEDNGVGIPEEDQGRIFDRFFRGEDPLVLATPGTGLGLAIVRQLVEMHNGRIWLKSEGVNKGSTFSFTLPVYKKDEQRHG